MPSTVITINVEKNIRRLHRLYEDTYDKELSAFIVGIAEEITQLQAEVKSLSRKKAPRKKGKNGAPKVR